jgi:hypothetical protein
MPSPAPATSLDRISTFLLLRNAFLPLRIPVNSSTEHEEQQSRYELQLIPYEYVFFVQYFYVFNKNEHAEIMNKH